MQKYVGQHRMLNTINEKSKKILETVNKHPKANIIVVMSVVLILMSILLISAVSTVNINDSIVFNEVISGNSKPIGDGELGTPDWIELYNPTKEDMDLTGYRLTDSTNSEGTALNNVVIKKGGYLLVYASKNYVPKDGNICFVNFGISSAGETLYLLNPDNVIVSELTVPALYTDVSYARKGDGTYGFCTETTPGSQNSEKIMDADELNAMLGGGGLTLSEVFPKGSDGSAWAEVFNPSGSDIYLGNYCLTDIEGDKVKWHFPGQILKSGEYAIVNLSGFSDNESEIHASFKLGAGDTSIYLYDVMGNCLGNLNWDKDIPYGISVVGEGTYTAYPTKGGKNSEETFSSFTENSMDNSDPVRINEVLPENVYSISDTDGDRCEWVEIYNSGNESVNLKGYFLSDDKSDLLKWAFPDDIIIEPGSYKIIFLSGKPSKEGELHASFRLSDGESVYLTNTKGFRVDCLPLPESVGDNISVGRDESGKPQYYAYPTPGIKNAKGFEDPSLIGFFNKSGVYISEICAANKVKSGKNDWIELYNGSDSDIDLTGYYLSDDTSNPQKWRMASASIKSKGYTVIEASSNKQDNTADFGISPTGEVLLLSDNQGEIIDIFETGVLKTGITSGRVEDDNSVKRVYFDKPTRGGANSRKYLDGYTQMPVFSDTGLYHTDKFSVEITCATPNANIYYTTDGSVPTDDSKAYTGPISISRNTPLRAAAYSKELLPSQITTSTYLFEQAHTVPVFCINGDPREIRDVLKTDKKYYKPEYDVNVEYYEADGTLGTTFLSGLRPGGRASLQNPQNSLKLLLRSSYGVKSVTYPFFEGSNVTNYSTLMLRNAGQDNRNARMRDPYFQTVIKGINVDGIRTRTVVAYVNGEYRGVYDLNEEENEAYIKTYYGIDSDNLDIISRDRDVICGDNEEFLNVRKIARTWDLADDKVFAEFSKLVDIDACTDYLIAQIYFGNGDVLNQKFWRAQDYSVKWRPLLFDLDWCFRFNDGKRDVFDKYFTYSPRAGNGTVTHMDIFCGMKKNKAWRDKFVERFVQLSVTQFSTERLLGIFDEMVKTMNPEMEKHIDKFRTPRSMETWKNEYGKLRDDLEARQDVVLKQLQRYFDVSNSTIQKYIEKYTLTS